MAAKEQTESEKRVGSIKRSVRYKDIREDLNDQLEHSGNSSKYTIDLVEDYMIRVGLTLLRKTSINAVRISICLSHM